MEEQLAKQQAELAACRRQLPMVRVEKNYLFEGVHGPASLRELFDGCRQLIIFHLMFDPAWDSACPSCSEFADQFCPGVLEALRSRDTAFAAVSRASWGKLRASSERKRWDFPWYSSIGSDFNYDFHVTLDERVAPVMHNFWSKDEILATDPSNDLIVSEIPVEVAGLSCFVRDERSVFHTYSAYDRAVDDFWRAINPAKRLLDLTPRA